MKQRFWTKFVATIMSLATALSVISVPAAVPLASQVPATQQVDQEAERSAAEQVLHTLSEQTQPITAEASDRTSVPNRSLGVDVSSYQGTDMSGYARAGAKFCIVKTTEGTGWVNSKAAAQIRSAKANNMMVMGYHFAHCGGSVSSARNEANYAVSHARSMGVPARSYIAMDFETDAWGSRQANTDAAIAFMQTVRNAGYLPLFYSGSAYMNAHFDTNQIVQKFPGSLWVASYKVLGRQDSPDFDYFPSRNGIAIWQFTDNLKGMGVDGSINVLPLSFLQPAPQPQPQPKPNPTYQTKIHFLDSQAGNREVGSQTVSGHQGDRRSYSVPENYHANSGQSNQVTISNNGSVNVYVSHNTETVHQNRSVTRRVLGTLTSSDGTTGSYEYSQTKQVPVTGTKDAVTGKTDWTAVPDFNQIFGEYHPDFAADAAKSKFSYSSQFDHAVLDHVDRSAPAGSSTETVHVYWKAAAAKPALSAGSASSHRTSSASSASSAGSASSHRASESSEHHSSSSASSSSASSSSSSSSSASSSSASSSSSSSSSASSSSASSSSDAQTAKPENAVVAFARRTVKFEFADGTTKTVVQTATCHADSDGLVDFAGWGMINVPVRQGEVADCSQVPAVSNARELQMYWNSAFSKTHQTSHNQYDQTVVIKYAQNQTSKPQPAKLSRHGSSRTDASAGDSQMGTAARKELQELTKNPAAGSQAENMSRAQAQKYVQARNDATSMNASYNGSPAKQDRHSYVGNLPQTGDVSADRKLQIAAGAGVLICLSAAAVTAVMISRRRRIQQQKQSK